MKFGHAFSYILISSAIAGCGGNEPTTGIGSQTFSPAPMQSNLSVTGPRNNYNIIRTASSTIVVDKLNASVVIDASNASSIDFTDLHVNLTLSARVQQLSITQVQSLIELYIAFFNRVPDSDGLAYWMDQLIASRSLAQIAENFYQAGIITSEFSGYTKDMSAGDFVRIVYKNVLGRTGASAPSDAEVNYWVNDLTSGRQTKSSLVSSMLYSARLFANDPDYGWVTRLLNNKIELGKYVALEQSVSFADAGKNITRGVQIIAAVTPNDTSDAKAVLGIDDAQFSATMRAPSPPQDISVTAQNGTALFRFDTPLDDGGALITAFTVTCTFENAKLQTTASNSPITLSGLDSGKTYQCSMRAINRYDQSISSPLISVTNGSGQVSSAFGGDIILGSPTDSSVRIKLFSTTQSGLVSLSYGVNGNNFTQNTSVKNLIAGTPLEFQIEGLPSDANINYAIKYQSDASLSPASSPTYTFHTARKSNSNSSFSFTVQADSHLDENSSLAQYQRTLDNILLDHPDFHIDLGDTFMTEKHTGPFDAVVRMATSQSVVDARYIYERQHFGRIGHSVPLFLANGNHEGELGWLNNNTANTIAVWAGLARQKFYVNPQPSQFYSGDTNPTNFVGLRSAWYAWNWGDALFIVLDPYWNSKAQASKDAWNLTLGAAQFQWLANTLNNSKAKYKFVFLHNLVGGLDGQMRGGIEAAPFYEWGGKNADGSYGFDEKRPGWGIPIHQLLVKNKVTAVFHGHDHVYVCQILDGVLYQEVPQPSAANNTSGANLARDYHYENGLVQSSSGHIRVSVSPQGVKTEYVRSWLPTSETASRKNRQIDDTWQSTTP